MKIALAQIDTTIGDFDGNVAKILTVAAEAERNGADLCCFPEQSIPGYPAHDLLERSEFIRGNLEALDRLRRYEGSIGIVAGFAEPTNRAVGKGLYNSAALITGGKVASVHRKSLLPTYDVFDESRYFDSADSVSPAEFRGVKLGLTICEDVWNDPDFMRRRLYPADPVGELIAQGAEIIINIAASPFTIEKRTFRREMLRHLAENHQRPLLFVNSVGGNDELVFDGASLAFDANGEVCAEASEFREDVIYWDSVTSVGDIRSRLESDEEAALHALALGTRDYAAKCGFKSAILGLSGGVDSALVLAIGAMALGPERIEGVLMPSRFSSAGSITDAEELARNLGVKTHTVPIEPLYSDYLKSLEGLWLGRESDVTEENLQARIRGNIVMALSNKFGHLVLTTGNKSEMATGYCTLYGDMAGGLAVLADVPKTLVYKLCEVVNREREIIPRAILAKAPSAELRPNQTDQDSLPPYDLLDRLIDLHVVEGMDRQKLVAEGFDRNVVEKVIRLVRSSEYKRRQAAPGFKITSKSFGYGRRIPLAQRWKA